MDQCVTCLQGNWTIRAVSENLVRVLPPYQMFTLGSCLFRGVQRKCTYLRDAILIQHKPAGIFCSYDEDAAEEEEEDRTRDTPCRE
jgi:hypothetical protein